MIRPFVWFQSALWSRSKQTMEMPVPKGAGRVSGWSEEMCQAGFRLRALPEEAKRLGIWRSRCRLAQRLAGHGLTVAGLTPLLAKAVESVAASKRRMKAEMGGTELREGKTSDTTVRNHPQRTSVQSGPMALSRRRDGSSASLCFSLPNAEAMRCIIPLSIGGAQHWCTRPFRRFGNVLILCDF